jgi:hypothetical protein
MAALNGLSVDYVSFGVWVGSATRLGRTWVSGHLSLDERVKSLPLCRSNIRLVSRAKP